MLLIIVGSMWRKTNSRLLLLFNTMGRTSLPRSIIQTQASKVLFKVAWLSIAGAVHVGGCDDRLRGARNGQLLDQRRRKLHIIPSSQSRPAMLRYDLQQRVSVSQDYEWLHQQWSTTDGKPAT